MQPATSHRFRSLVGLLPLALLAISGSAAQVFAQNSVDGVGDGSRVQLVMERTASRGVRRAQESIAAGEFTQAIQFLDDVLGRDQDLFIETDANGGYRGLKETARELIRDLPPEGRQAYETAFGAAAQRLLKSAVESGSPRDLELVARRYFYTPAGYEAAFLLAMDQADAGLHHSAALNYQQLLEAPAAVERFEPHLSLRAAVSWLAIGNEEQANATLEQLIKRGKPTVQIAGKPVRLESAASALAMLRDQLGRPSNSLPAENDQWLTYRGNAARNGQSSGGLPHMRVRWKVRLLGHPQLESLYQSFAADLARTGNLAPIASSPIAAGDYVLTRTPHGLLAIEFSTGKRVWRSEPQREPELERLMRAGQPSEEDAANPEPARSFARRLWEDYLYGLVSSDGSRVYMIRDLPMPMAQDYNVSPFMGGGFEEIAQTNRLSAYDLATQGKLVWEVDGAAATDELAGAFFLGAPLTVGESLFVMAEIKGGVHLVALDRATGRSQWQQQLANLETSVVLDLRRRLQSAMPSYEDGMLVCPTGAGLVVTVDLAKRSLAWAYRYETTTRAPVIYQGRDDEGAGAMARRWQDSTATIVAGRVLLTPPESNELHCIDLQSGRVLWKQPRGDMTRIAAADAERLLLLGNRKLRALRTEDGKPAWKRDALALPRGVSPSGTGFVSGDRYFLPLTSAEVIAIDLNAGKIESRAASRDGAPLGNLICHRGTVISQTGVFLDCFDEIEQLRKRSQQRLEQEPNDVEALRTLGEIAYNDGRLVDAIELLERAYGADPDNAEVQEVLFECLTAALDQDFAGHRERLALFKSLEDGPSLRKKTILRIEAQGMLQEGDVLASAAACLELYRTSASADEMFSTSRKHSTAVSRWAQAQLLEIWSAADASQRSDLERQLKQEAQTLGEAPGRDELARFLAFFGKLPIFEPLNMAYSRQLTNRDEWLEAQLLLLDLEKSSNEQLRNEAVARIASQLHDAGLPLLSAEYDRKLQSLPGDAKVLDELTAQELLARWAAGRGQPDPWPRGSVTVSTAATGNNVSPSRVASAVSGVRFERSDSILGRCIAQLSSRAGEIVLQDGLGRDFFNATLDVESQLSPRRPGATYAVTRGNLMVVSMGKQLAAFNTLATQDGLAPKVVWRCNLGSNLNFGGEFFGEAHGAENRLGSNRAPRPMDEGKWVGVIGPVTSQGVVYQDQGRLLCVDATTGEVRWSRTDVPQGCDLFGDDQYVVAVPTGSSSARIYSAVDGRALGKRTIPPWREQLATRGRQVFRWIASGEAAELSAVDAVTGETAWRHEFEAGAAIDIEMGRYIAVAEARGQITVIDGEDGDKLVDAASVPRATIEAVHLAVATNDFQVVVNRPPQQEGTRIVRGFNPLDSPVINGDVYLFDRGTGQMRWNRPAEIMHQALVLTQGVDLPFIVFASNVMRNESGGGARSFSTVLLLDKATGRTLYQSDELPQAGGGHCAARVTDAGNRQAAVEMAGQTILLQFTNQRRPPQPPALAEVESTVAKTRRGLMGIFLDISNGR